MSTAEPLSLGDALAQLSEHIRSAQGHADAVARLVCEALLDGDLDEATDLVERWQDMTIQIRQWRELLQRESTNG